MELFGIDFGAQMAGTTVIAHFSEASQHISLIASVKKQSADALLKQYFHEVFHRENITTEGASILHIVSIDAPLSLPRVYTTATKNNPDEDDYLFRHADRELSAMSPMFLGGLTARAMRLTAFLQTNKILSNAQTNLTILETYPAAQARRLGLKELDYKGEKARIGRVCEQLQQEFPCALPPQEEIQTWHHVDALLCLCASLRFARKQHETYGDAEEGQIFI